METVIMHPENKEQLSALKAFAKALKVKYETNNSPYNADFVKKVKESEKQINEGKFVVLDPNKTIWENIG
jgi:outer membrane lipoprotein-sorting protein